VEYPAAFVDVGLHQPGHRGEVRVPRPAGLVAVAVEARTAASARVSGEFYCGSAVTVGFEWSRPYGTSWAASRSPMTMRPAMPLPDGSESCSTDLHALHQPRAARALDPASRHDYRSWRRKERR
jgi:hypothetical protein